jgi:hypothetical protein
MVFPPGLYGVDVEKSPKDLAPSTMDAVMGNPFFAMFLDNGMQVGNNQAPAKRSAVSSGIAAPVQKPAWAVGEAPHFVPRGPAGNPPENTIWIGSGNGIDTTREITPTAIPIVTFNAAARFDVATDVLWVQVTTVLGKKVFRSGTGDGMLTKSAQWMTFEQFMGTNIPSSRWFEPMDEWKEKGDSNCCWSGDPPKPDRQKIIQSLRSKSRVASQPACIPYMYNTLSVEKREIRLLHLLPNQNQSNPIEYFLTTISLSHNSIYNALSCIWGDTNITTTITVN